MAKRPIGWQITITSTYCRKCVPDGVSDSYEPMREGDDYGVAYHCDMCGESLTPCDHEWGAWNPWFQGGEWRSCDRNGCSEIERRELVPE